MHRYRLIAVAALLSSLLLAGWIVAQDTQQRRGFSIAITEPANQELIVGKTKIAAKVKVDDPDLLDRVEFVVGDEVIFVDREPPFVAKPGAYILPAEPPDQAQRRLSPARCQVAMLPPGMAKPAQAPWV